MAPSVETGCKLIKKLPVYHRLASLLSAEHYISTQILLLSVCGHSTVKNGLTETDLFQFPCLILMTLHFGALKSFEVKRLWFEYLHKKAVCAFST